MCTVFIQRYIHECALGIEVNSDVEFDAFVTRLRQHIAQDLKNELVGQLSVPWNRKFAKNTIQEFEVNRDAKITRDLNNLAVLINMQSMPMEEYVIQKCSGINNIPI